MGTGPWMGPTWWWIFPVVGLAVCLFFMIAMMRMMSGGGFMCMGRRDRESEETAQLRREVADLRERIEKRSSAL